jgi:pheromone shutdown protein TraB
MSFTKSDALLHALVRLWLLIALVFSLAGVLVTGSHARSRALVASEISPPHPCASNAG